MTTSQAVILASIGLAILIALASWAIVLLIRLKRQSPGHQRQGNNRQHARNSIALLARAALDEQVDLSEACIRIATLLDYLAIEPVERQRWANIYRLSEATAHIPRLQQWQDLSSAERKAYREEKEQLEREARTSLHPPLLELIERFGQQNPEPAYPNSA